MADRSVVVRLRADITNYMTSMAAAAKVTKDFGVSAVESASKNKKAWGDIGQALALGGAALSLVAAAALKAAADFDASMSVLKANVDDKSAPAMKRLGDAALEAGRTTAFSAGQAVEAETELAKAGLHAAEITGGALAAALSLASAGQLDLGAAAEYTASTMVQFGLKASDAGHIADVLAAGADKSLGGVGDLAEGLKYAGVTASQFGLSIDETVGLLADFASVGIQGSMAGTGLREMLVSLANPTKEAQAEIRTLGLRFFDANGQFLGMSNAAQELHTKLGGLSEQQRQQVLVTMFGTRALAEANVLYRDGAAGVDKWTAAVNDQGFAALQASTKLDNLNGDLTKLKNSLNAAFIEAGQGGQGMLRTLVQDVTSAVNAFANLPGPVKSFVAGLTGLVGAALLAGGALMTFIPKVAATKAALAELGVSSLTASGALVGLAKAAGYAAIAIPVLDQISQRTASALGNVATAGDSAGKSLKAYLTTGKATGDNARLLNEAFGDLGATVNDVFSANVWHGIKGVLEGASPGRLWGDTGSIESAVKSWETIDAGLANLVQSGNSKQAQEMFSRLSAEAKAQGISMDDLAASLPHYAAAMSAAGGAQATMTDEAKKAAAASQANAQYLDEVAKKADEARKANDDLIRSVQQYNALLLGQRRAEDDFYASIDAATKAAKDNGKTLDVQTEKGRANRKALDDIASAALNMAAETFKNRDATTSLGDAVATATSQVDQGRVAFIKAATSMGMSKTAAEKLADQMGLTNTNVGKLSQTIANIPTPTLDANTAPGEAKLSGFAAKLDAMDRLVVTPSVNLSPILAAQNAINKLAAMDKSQGLFSGKYGGYTGDGGVDDVAGVVHGQEFVMTAQTVRRYGRGFFESLNGGMITAPSGGGSGGGGASMGMPSTVILRVGDREFTAYVGEVADGRVSAAAGSDSILQRAGH